MRIGFDLNPLGSHRSGTGTYCFYLLKNLQRLYPESELSGFSSGSSKVDLGGLAEHVRHRRLGVPTRLLYGWWQAFGRPEIDRLLGGLDVYHATNFFLPPARKAVRVLMVHDLAFLARPEYCDPALARPFSRRIKEFVKEADGLLTSSASTKRDVVQYLDVDPAKITVAPLAVDEDLCPMLPEAAQMQLSQRFGLRGPFILFVGTIGSRKNPANLVRAFGSLAKDFPHKLVLVGERGYGAAETFEAVAELGLEGRVVEVGYVPDYLQLRAFYSAAEVFVFPTRYEGFGLPVLEAMACGCAAVTSANSSMREVAGEAAMYADPESVEDLARAIRRVLEDPATREDLEVLGQDRAKMFCWEDCARATYKLYEHCLAMI